MKTKNLGVHRRENLHLIYLDYHTSGSLMVGCFNFFENFRDRGGNFAGLRSHRADTDGAK